MKIYVDMDGVLCNFEKMFSEVSGVPKSKIDKLDKKKFWKIIDDAGEDYWSDMDWMPGGEDLWDFVKGLDPIILSSPTKDKSSHTGKRKWVSKHLGDVKVILDSKKYKYADPDSILIDDLSKNIDPWEDGGGIGILHKDTSITLRKLKKILADNKKEESISDKVDKVASILESRGLVKEAYELDVIANTIEALDTYRNRPVVLDPYDAMVQKAVHQMGPALKDVDVIKLETSCSGNKLAWVSNQDLLKGAPGKQRVIHLCLNKIKENFKAKHNNSFTLSDPKEQKQMQDVIVQFLKDVVLPHETEHIHQEMEHGGDFGPSSEQKAERHENWKAVEDMGFKRK